MQKTIATTTIKKEKRGKNKLSNLLLLFKSKYKYKIIKIINF